jgi:spore photoproduct lyase
MERSEKSFLNPDFSHVYVERRVAGHPRTLRILQTLSKSAVILIDHYKEVFFRKNQSRYAQSQSMKLILAAREAPFFHKGSALCDSFGYTRFYYVTNAMNCTYHCEYCYLQGLYPSANPVIFINLEDSLKAVLREANEERIYLCISYDTDLLALEGITGLVGEWIDFSRENPHLTIELRTKSANFHRIAAKKPVPGWILAWSLSPKTIAKHFESGTPSLEMRIRDMRHALDAGWRVRLCIDPILHIPEWRTDYKAMADMIQKELNVERLEGISIGVFRVPGESLQTLRKENPKSSVLAYPFVLDKTTGSWTYPETVKSEMIDYIKKLL